MFSFGIILWLVDRFSSKVRNLDHIKPMHALLIGISQALAIIPGVSRSGSTMTAALALGFKRADAARFSFLMSIPIIFGAGLAKASHFHDGVTTPELFIGFITAAVFGFLSIKFLLRLLSKKGFTMFVWYRIIFAIVLLVVYFVRK